MNQPATPQPSHHLFYRFWGAVIVLILLGVGLAWLFVEPAPPKHAVIATGREDGDYYAVAKKYAELFAKNGIQLEVRATQGSAENYQLLNDPNSGVDLAIVQGGTLPGKLNEPLEGIASIYFEPLWIFYRGKTALDRIDALAGKKIAIGAEGSGTRELALRLLSAYGMAEATPTSATKPAPVSVVKPGVKTMLLPLGGSEAMAALESGTIDAALLVASPKSTQVRELLSRDDIQPQGERIFRHEFLMFGFWPGALALSWW